MELSGKKVASIFRELDVRKNTRKTAPKPIKMKKEFIDPNNGLSLMERAKKVLGPRMTERVGFGYYLDGKPASAFVIAEAAGLELK